LKKNLLLAVALAFGVSALSAAPLCPQSNAVNVQGIGDGCTIPPGSSVLFPQIGAYQSMFTPACQRHDKCYSTLGTSYAECDGRFLNDMQSACNQISSAKRNWLGVLIGLPPGAPGFADPVSCHSTALQYSGAVSAWRSTQDPLPGIQAEALRRSRSLETTLQSEACETVPEATSLFSASLVSKVNNTFQTYLGRQPTVLEFFQAVNSANVVSNPAGWEAQLPSVVTRTTPRTASARHLLYRYSDRTGRHFYTQNASEGAGWIYEGNVGYLADKQTVGTVAMHRYWNSRNGDHLYTTHWNELGSGADGWVYESIVGYCASAPVAGTMPLYRYNSGHAGHFMTQHYWELNQGAMGWGLEGVVCHAYTAPQ
jgi:hypothetical protein